MSQRKQKFGQHFLKDESIAEKIVSFANIKKNETVLEIGPGKGIFTSILLRKAQKTIAVEVDRRLVDYLNKRFSGQTALDLIHSDFLEYDLSLLPDNVKIIGNLPYNIGTRIVKYLIGCREKSAGMIFMIQKEVAERFVALPGVKEYGSLSIFLQLYFNIEILMTISPESFSPPPKVFSTLVMMKSKKPPFEKTDNPALFHKIVKLAFSQRRKKLRNNLKAFPLQNDVMKKVSQEACIDLDLRGEMLGIEDYLRLARSFNAFKIN